MQNTKTHSLPITGDQFRGGNPASPSPDIPRAKRRCFDSREIPGKQLFLRSHLLYRHSKEPPARSWGFLRTVSATRLLGWNAPRVTYSLGIPLSDGDRLERALLQNPEDVSPGRPGWCRYYPLRHGRQTQRRARIAPSTPTTKQREVLP
jgi:hypothetical protein